MSHSGTITYIWSYDNLPQFALDFWEDHFRFLDPGLDGLPVEIEYSYSAGYPAKTDGPPERCYPGEDPEVEISSLLATVPYSSDGAKADHLDAYPPCGSDVLTCASQQEFCNMLLGAWESWLDNPVNFARLRTWLLEKAADIEANDIAELQLDWLEADHGDTYCDN